MRRRAPNQSGALATGAGKRRISAGKPALPSTGKRTPLELGRHNARDLIQHAPMALLRRGVCVAHARREPGQEKWRRHATVPRFAGAQLAMGGGDEALSRRAKRTRKKNARKRAKRRAWYQARNAAAAPERDDEAMERELMAAEESSARAHAAWTVANRVRWARARQWPGSLPTPPLTRPAAICRGIPRPRRARH